MEIESTLCERYFIGKLQIKMESRYLFMNNSNAFHENLQKDQIILLPGFLNFPL